MNVIKTVSQIRIEKKKIKLALLKLVVKVIGSQAT